MAGDVFNFFQFPMLCSVIPYTFVVEEEVAHPGEPLPFVERAALAVGLILFVGGMDIAFRRATAYLLLPRVVLTVGTAAAVAVVEQRAGHLLS